MYTSIYNIFIILRVFLVSSLIDIGPTLFLSVCVVGLISHFICWLVVFFLFFFIHFWFVWWLKWVLLLKCWWLFSQFFISFLMVVWKPLKKQPSSIWCHLFYLFCVCVCVCMCFFHYSLNKRSRIQFFDIVHMVQKCQCKKWQISSGHP